MGMHAFQKKVSKEAPLSQLKHVLDSESDLGLEPLGEEVARF